MKCYNVKKCSFEVILRFMLSKPHVCKDEAFSTKTDSPKGLVVTEDRKVAYWFDALHMEIVIYAPKDHLMKITCAYTKGVPGGAALRKSSVERYQVLYEGKEMKPVPTFYNLPNVDLTVTTTLTKRRRQQAISILDAIIKNREANVKQA